MSRQWPQGRQRKIRSDATPELPMHYDPTSSLREPVPVLSPTPTEAWAQRLLREFALQDAMAIAYNSFLLAAAVSGSGPLQRGCIARASLAVGVVTGSILLVRTQMVRQRLAVLALYLVGMFTTVLGSYFQMRELLPTATTRRVDEMLYQLDLSLFGFEPTLWLDQFVTPATTAWFAFFYFSYFAYLAVHIFPMLLLCRRRRLVADFSLGLVGVYCMAQLGYFALPGYGPYHHLAHLYTHPLPHGFWQDMVQEAVATSGALLDIFPSLHTAGPLYIALFSLFNRHEKPFRYTWPIALFFSLNIIGATLFMRWHYLIDVVVGAALALSWALVTSKLRASDEARRRRQGARTPFWPLLGNAVGEPEARR
jgi:membrane-associated phospholipid phosphatase